MTSKEYSSLRDKLEGLVLATASRITGYALRAASIAVIAAAVSYAPVRADTVRPRQEAKQEANSVEDRVRSYLDPARFESRRRIGEFTDVALKGGSVLHYHASKDAVYVDVLEDGKRVSGIGFNDATNTVIVEGIGDKSYPQATYAALRKEAVTYFEGNVPKPEPKAEKPEPTIPKAEPKPEPKQEPKQEPSRPDLEATLRAYFNPENITHRTYFTQPLKANEHWVIPQGIEVILKDGTCYLFERKSADEIAIAVYKQGSPTQTGAISAHRKGKTINITPDKGTVPLAEPEFTRDYTIIVPFFEGDEINPRQELKEPLKPEPKEPPKEPKPEAQPEPTQPAQVLTAPERSRLLFDDVTAVNRSTGIYRAFAALDTPWAHILTYGGVEKERERVSNEPIRRSNFGTTAEIDASVAKIMATYEQSKRTRDSFAHSVSSDPNFIITTDTNTREELLSRYLAGKVELDLGVRPQLTIYDSRERLSVNTVLDLMQDDLMDPDPIGDFTTRSELGQRFTSKTRGAQFGAFGDSGNITVGALGNIERFTRDQDHFKLTTYRLDFFTQLNFEEWALGGDIGDRLLQDGEENNRFDRVHGFVNGAAHLGRGMTLGGSFWRLDQPGGSAGLVFGEGNAVKLLMDYQNARAWDMLDLVKERGPDGRKAYIELLWNDFVETLADDKLRLFLFGGVRRQEVNGDERARWFADAALSIPVAPGTTLLPFARYEQERLQRIIEGGLKARVGSWWAGASAGQYDIDGLKNDRVPLFKLSIGKNF